MIELEAQKQLAQEKERAKELEVLANLPRLVTELDELRKFKELNEKKTLD